VAFRELAVQLDLDVGDKAEVPAPTGHTTRLPHRRPFADDPNHQVGELITARAALAATVLAGFLAPALPGRRAP
jgi:hypothetical protein